MSHQVAETHITHHENKACFTAVRITRTSMKGEESKLNAAPVYQRARAVTQSGTGTWHRLWITPACWAWLRPPARPTTRTHALSTGLCVLGNWLLCRSLPATRKAARRWGRERDNSRLHWVTSLRFCFLCLFMSHNNLALKCLIIYVSTLNQKGTVPLQPVYILPPSEHIYTIPLHPQRTQSTMSIYTLIVHHPFTLSLYTIPLHSHWTPSFYTLTVHIYNVHLHPHGTPKCVCTNIRQHHFPSQALVN